MKSLIENMVFLEVFQHLLNNHNKLFNLNQLTLKEQQRKYPYYRHHLKQILEVL